MNEVVFDASVMLAFLNHEPGHERLTFDLLARSVASAVNLAEVQSKLIKRGGGQGSAWLDALSSVNSVEPYTIDHAKIAGDLILSTERYGLSLGDRCCLALAITLQAPVYTAERIWKNLKIGVPIHVIR